MLKDKKVAKRNGGASQAVKNFFGGLWRIIKGTKHDVGAIRVMKDFVEGKMSIQEFKHQFDHNPLIKKTFSKYPNRPRKVECGYDYLSCISGLDINRRGDALCFYGFMEEFLRLNKYDCVTTEYYHQRYVFLIKIQPDWLDITDENFLDEQVLSKVPEGLTEPQKIAWCKARIKGLFRYDKSWPRWIQGPEWPIANGKPLVFRERTKAKNGDIRVYYIFYDPDTGDEIKVEQFT